MQWHARGQSVATSVDLGGHHGCKDQLEGRRECRARNAFTSLQVIRSVSLGAEHAQCLTRRRHPIRVGRARKRSSCEHPCDVLLGNSAELRPPLRKALHEPKSVTRASWLFRLGAGEEPSSAATINSLSRVEIAILRRIFALYLPEPTRECFGAKLK
jgi:hypothetical protein